MNLGTLLVFYIVVGLILQEAGSGYNFWPVMLVGAVVTAILHSK